MCVCVFHSIPVLSNFLIIRLSRCLLLTLLRNDDTVKSVTRTDLIQRTVYFIVLYSR